MDRPVRGRVRALQGRPRRYLRGPLRIPVPRAERPAGARVLYISNEHPDVLERLAPSPDDEQKVRAGMRLLRDAKPGSS